MEKRLSDEEYRIVEDGYVPFKKQEKQDGGKKEDLIEDEYTILEDDEDRKRRELEEMFEEIEQERVRREKFGPLCSMISELQFLQDKSGNSFVYYIKPTPLFAITGIVEKNFMYAKVNGVIDKDFAYPHFHEMIKTQMLQNGVKEMDFESLVEVYRFLKSDISEGHKNNPNINLVFRENPKSKKTNVYVDVKMGNQVIKEEVPIKNADAYCKNVNDSLYKKTPQKKNCFGGGDK